MPLSLSAACALAEPKATEYQPDHERELFQRVQAAQFGVVSEEERIRRGTNVSFIDLAESALRALPVPVIDPDLVIVAYALPDIGNFSPAAAHINHLLGGRARSFAISEQGLRAPYTALRVADAYARSGRCSSLALFVCEQHTYPYQDPFVEDNALANSAALLYFDDRGRYQPHSTSATATDDTLGDLLRAATTSVDRGSTLIVAGPWAGTDHLERTGLPVHRAAGGTYCTSVWMELARHHENWVARYPWIVLCDTDPRTGWSQVTLLGSGTPAPPATPTPAASALMERP